MFRALGGRLTWYPPGPVGHKYDAGGLQGQTDLVDDDITSPVMFDLWLVQDENVPS